MNNQIRVSVPSLYVFFRLSLTLRLSLQCCSVLLAKHTSSQLSHLILLFASVKSGSWAVKGSSGFRVHNSVHRCIIAFKTNMVLPVGLGHLEVVPASCPYHSKAVEECRVSFLTWDVCSPYPAAHCFKCVYISCLTLSILINTASCLILTK